MLHEDLFRILIPIGIYLILLAILYSIYRYKKKEQPFKKALMDSLIGTCITIGVWVVGSRIVVMILFMIHW